MGIGFPANLASEGFGSKVSTCDTPPFMNKCRTRLALAGSGGVLGASGFTALPSSAACRQPPLCNVELKATMPIPMPQRDSISRLVNNKDLSFIATLPLIDKAELVSFQQHLSISCPYGKRLRPRTGEIVLRIPGIGPAFDHR